MSPYLVLIPVAFIQPVVGAQLFLLFSGTHLIRFLVTKDSSLTSRAIYAMLIWVLTGGVWIILLKMRFNSVPIASEELIKIFEFRLSHHYLPGYFSAVGKVAV